MKIVCIGDSLTFGYELPRPYRWTNLLSKLSGRFEVVNKGINGDTTGGMLTRFEADVLKEAPDVMILMGGSNDFIFEGDFDAAKRNIGVMVRLAREAKIKVFLGVPMKIDSEMAMAQWGGSYDYVNDCLLRYRQWLVKFSDQADVALIDFYGAFEKIMDDENKYDYLMDGIHPSVKGVAIMMDAIRDSKFMRL